MSIRDSKGFYVYKNMVLIPEPLNLRWVTCSILFWNIVRHTAIKFWGETNDLLLLATKNSLTRM
jgi:hypothetical protein